jgi:dihydrofolate reductase
MQEWIIIASADNNWGIGYKNRLLARVPEDMKSVSEKTKGKVIVMGRKTLESFPSGKPLPDRLNVVLTRDINYSAEGALIVHSIEELMEALRDYHAVNHVQVLFNRLLL